MALGPQSLAFATSRGVNLPLRAVRREVTGRAGEICEVDLEADQPTRIVIAGLGDYDAISFRRMGAAVARATSGAKGRVVVAATLGATPITLAAFVEGYLLGAYSFRITNKPASDSDSGPRDAVLHVPRINSALRSALDTAIVTATAVVRARDLGNTPSNTKSPEWLAAQCVDDLRDVHVTTNVWDLARLEREGMGGVIAVGQGSVREPRVVEMRYRPQDVRAGAPHIVLVGKGITYDSGGISLKPPDGMVAMKTDMCGAAAVIATMSTLHDLGVRVPVTALVALAENMPSGSAQRPGDVLTQYGGRTVEVINTDAEGRLVLADLLAYANAKLDPDVVIDLATLTGAASLGLGKRHGALYATDYRLTKSLLAAADLAGERLWHMPFVEDLAGGLQSPVADLSHIAWPAKLGGGSITAALFLREFVGQRRWAHLDIAGPARSDSVEHEVSKGATGFGVRLLTRYLQTQR